MEQELGQHVKKTDGDGVARTIERLHQLCTVLVIRGSAVLVDLKGMLLLNFCGLL